MGNLRIIGGKWRGRCIEVFPDLGIRPTSNRIKETLFNWLGNQLIGARCLDLFAGSGSLGIEALSRGAEEVVFIENNSIALQHLNKQLVKLGSKGQAKIVLGDALVLLPKLIGPFNIVFIDPPFHTQLASVCCQQLEVLHLLSPKSWVYVEAEANVSQLVIPEGWISYRHKKAGHVSYRLFQTP